MEQKKTVLDELEPFFEMAGGLSLSQLCAVAKIESATVQNWVKRGFVSRPIAKKYSKEQCARILMIHALRDTMKLEKIAELISYVNGDLVDATDDIILDSALYQYFCHITTVLTERASMDLDVIQTTIREELNNYLGTTQEQEKLEIALSIMALAYGANHLQRKADQLYQEGVFGG